MSREILLPGPDHPITITPTAGRIVVGVGGQKVADTTAALTLQESDYPPAYYLPLDSIDPALLTKTETSTWCPYKGDASYYDLVTPDGVIEDAAWTYTEPYDNVSEIAGHLAFYPDKVVITVS